MDRKYIDEMARQFESVGLDTETATRVLSEYWRNKIAIVWTCENPEISEAWDNSIVDEQSDQALRRAFYDCNMDWDLIKSYACRVLIDRKSL